MTLLLLFAGVGTRHGADLVEGDIVLPPNQTSQLRMAQDALRQQRLRRQDDDELVFEMIRKLFSE